MWDSWTGLKINKYRVTNSNKIWNVECNLFEIVRESIMWHFLNQILFFAQLICETPAKANVNIP